MKKKTKIMTGVVVLILTTLLLPGLLEFSLGGPNTRFVSPGVGTVVGSIKAKTTFSHLGDIDIPQYDTYYYYDTAQVDSPWFSTVTTIITQVVDGKVDEVVTISEDLRREPVITRKKGELSELEINSPETRETELRKMDTCRSIMSKSLFSNKLVLRAYDNGSVYCGYVPYGHHSIMQDSGFSPESGVAIDTERFHEGHYSLDDFYSAE